MSRVPELGWTRSRVAAELGCWVPAAAGYCVLAQWPLWTGGNASLAAANLLVTLAFSATSVFVRAEAGHRVTGLALAAAVLLWPLNWVNEWHRGVLPLVAAMEGPLYGLVAVWALLRYPVPWSRRWQDAATLVAVAVIQVIAVLPVFTSLPQWHHGLTPGTPWLAWWPDRRAFAVTSGIYNVGAVAVAAAAVIALTVRLARLAGPDRRVMRPVATAVVLAGIFSAAWGAGTIARLPGPTLDALSAVEGVTLACVPLMLAIAAARRWLAREWVPKLIRELNACLTPACVQRALQIALEDPSLRLLYRVGDEYVDIEGQPASTTDRVPAGQAEITPASPSANVALLTASPILDRYPDTVHAAARAAILALENAGLQTALRASIREVGQSSRRLEAAVYAERRSIQSAVADICGGDIGAMAASLEAVAGMADATRLSGQLAVARELMSRAELDLTRLSEGLAPAGLAGTGLADLARAAARRLSPLITVSASNEPLPPAIAAGAYLVLSELMTNAVKHAPDAAVQVRIARTGPDLLLEVTDNGPGGAVPDGSGLHGVAERATALGGSFLLTRPPGGGTRAVARLPVG